MTPDENATTIAMSGLALAIFLTSIICLALSAVTVCLRIYVRIHDKALGLDDHLILAGLIIYAVDVGLACHGATVGLGSLNKDLNTYMQVQGIKYLMIWMIIYVVGLAVIKSSICVTLLRIASTNNAYRISIFTLLGLTWASFLVTFIGILLYCKPISANWTGQGTCASSQTMIALSYTSTACTIATDMSCAVLPGVMLWNTQMQLSKKWSVMVLLSFGSIASISTMIRAPYIESYWTPTDNLAYYTGFIVLLSNIESAIGLIASSIPTLRKLIIRKARGGSDRGAVGSGPKSLVTFGSAPVQRKGGFRNPTDQGMTFATVHASANRDWTRLRDGDSDTTAEEALVGHGGGGGGGIRAEYTYEVEMSRLSGHVEEEVVVVVPPAKSRGNGEGAV